MLYEIVKLNDVQTVLEQYLDKSISVNDDSSKILTCIDFVMGDFKII